MTTATLAPSPTHTAGVGLANAFGVGSVLAALGSFGFISLNWTDSARDAFMHPVGIVSSMVATTGIVVLALALVRWRTSLPDWAVLTAAAGLILTAAGAWFYGTGIVAIGEFTDDELFLDIGRSGWMVALWIPKIGLCAVAFTALAITGWRSRVIPRTASVAFGVAAIASLMPVHPPGLLFASLALFVVSRTQLESRT